MQTSKPVVVNWRWYYHLPSLAFWALALLPLFLKENRYRQTWAILIALMAVMVVSRMLNNLFSTPPAVAETSGMFLTTLATAWTIVWLLGQRLSNVRGGTAFLVAAIIMLLIGLLSYASCVGLTYNKNLPPLATYYALAVFDLLLPITLSRRCCRAAYLPRRFMGWLLFWMVAVMVASMLLLIAITLVALAPGGTPIGSNLIRALPFALIIAPIWAVVLYLVNLPFMLVAFRTSFYQERFCRVLRLVKAMETPAIAEGHEEQ